MATDIILEDGALAPAAPPQRTRLRRATANKLPSQGWVSQRILEKNGHTLTYVGLVCFTILIYSKPQDLLHFETNPNLAFLFAAITLLLYIPTQLRLEGRLSARPRELNILLAFTALALLSFPLAVSRSSAWTEFNDMFLKAVLMFIVIINVVRTEQRLKGLLYLALAIAFISGASALNNHRVGIGLLEGYRATGMLTGVLYDPNDMSLYLVMVVPIAAALAMGTKSLPLKLFYGLCILTMIGGIIVTYSRGGFLGLVGVVGVFAWKSARRQPVAVVLGLVAFIGFIVLAPGNYVGRIASITNPNLDVAGSADERKELLNLSIQTTLHHPIFGVGFGNFPNVSFREKPSHNAYTQVSSEMGVFALMVYVLFMIVPILNLKKIEKETFGVPGYERFYALAVGLQASLVGYMVSSFFLSVAYYWFLYYFVAYAVCLRRIYETGPGRVVGHVTLTPAMGAPEGIDEIPNATPDLPSTPALRIVS
ncbi:MAG: O-antigen ligase family protein [Abitibacteriaceae bacterium]|nr:O-antigen ligase family protein [Abditibacteriaceae bacterium]